MRECNFLRYILLTSPVQNCVQKQVSCVYLKLSRQHAACVDVAGVGLNGLIVAQNLCSGSSGHGSQEQTVAYPMPAKQQKQSCSQSRLFVYRNFYIFSFLTENSWTWFGHKPGPAFLVQKCPVLSKNRHCPNSIFTDNWWIFFFACLFQERQ